MKSYLRTIFKPILGRFESNTDVLLYKNSHRTILLVMGVLFSGLAVAVVVLSPSEGFGYLLPMVVFGGVALVCLVVALLGTDQAVAKIWGSSKR